MSDGFIKAGEIARALQVCPKTISRWAEGGAMPAPVKVGGTIRFHAKAVEQWIQDGCPRNSEQQSEGTEQ